MGAGGLMVANAAPSAPSSFVSIDPARVLDTRTDVGLISPPFRGASSKLKVTGPVRVQPPNNAPAVTQQVVPPGATAVVLNVTVIRPVSKGFVSIRPGDASGFPATSNLNFESAGPNLANAVTVALPTSGSAAGFIDVFVNGEVENLTIDIAGFYQAGGGGDPTVFDKTAATTLDPGTKMVTNPITISPASPPADLGDGVEIIELDLPDPTDGAEYLITAKLNARASTSNPFAAAPLTCTIETFIANNPVDRATVDIYPGEVDNVVMVGTFTTPGGFGTVNVPVVCDPGPNSFELTNVVMTAIKVTSAP